MADNHVLSPSKAQSLKYACSVTWRLTVGDGITVQQLADSGKGGTVLIAQSKGDRITASSDSTVHEMRVESSPDSDTDIWVMRLAEGIRAFQDDQDEQLFHLEASQSKDVSIIAMPQVPARTAFLISPNPPDPTDADIERAIENHGTKPVPRRF